MHVYFSGISGMGIGPLALLAHQAGFEVSGSDARIGGYIDYIKSQGISQIYAQQTGDELRELHQKNPVDWYVYTSALTKENPRHPELMMAEKLGIKHSKRDEFLQFFIGQKKLKLIAIAGTHGKTTTTSMVVWLMKQLEIPVSYSVGAKLSFGSLAEYNDASEYFVYEADEYDRNFLSFSPEMSLITGVAYDHPDIYPTKEAYDTAFLDFISQSRRVVMWQGDIRILQAHHPSLQIIDEDDPQINHHLQLPGLVNRQNAWQVAQAAKTLFQTPVDKSIAFLNMFPGVPRRFEKIAQGIYSDYAHTPEKISGALQMAHEIAGDNVVVVYEGLHNTRQHFIRKQLKTLFDGVMQLYVVPSYKAREDTSLEDLTPEKLCQIITKPALRQPSLLNDELRYAIAQHANNGNLVLCLSAGGAGSLDSWLRLQNLEID